MAVVICTLENNVTRRYGEGRCPGGWWSVASSMTPMEQFIGWWKGSTHFCPSVVIKHKGLKMSSLQVFFYHHFKDIFQIQDKISLGISGLFAWSFLKGQRAPMHFLLGIKGILLEFLLEHFMGTKAMTRRHGRNSPLLPPWSITTPRICAWLAYYYLADRNKGTFIHTWQYFMWNIPSW